MRDSGIIFQKHRFKPLLDLSDKIKPYLVKCKSRNLTRKSAPLAHMTENVRL